MLMGGRRHDFQFIALRQIPNNTNSSACVFTVFSISVCGNKRSILPGHLCCGWCESDESAEGRHQMGFTSTPHRPHIQAARPQLQHPLPDIQRRSQHASAPHTRRIRYYVVFNKKKKRKSHSPLCVTAQRRNEQVIKLQYKLNSPAENKMFVIYRALICRV